MQLIRIPAWRARLCVCVCAHVELCFVVSFFTLHSQRCLAKQKSIKREVKKEKEREG